MKHFRYKFIGVLVWFFFLFNIEKLFGVVNIATFVYVLVFLYTVLLVLIRPLQRMALHWVLLLSLLPYIILKIQAGSPVTGMSLPLTVTEICSIWLTVVLVRSTVGGLEELRESISNLTLGHLTKKTEPFATGQSRIYHEIRRARRYQRPASLLAVSTTNQSVQIALDRCIKDAQLEIIDKYIEARTAKLLAEEIGDPGVILQRDDHFVVLLPETARESAEEIITQLKNAAYEQLGLKFQIGLASFPDEAVTFETLLADAEAEMISSGPVQQESLNLPSAKMNRALS